MKHVMSLVIRYVEKYQVQGQIKSKNTSIKDIWDIRCIRYALSKSLNTIM